MRAEKVSVIAAMITAISTAILCGLVWYSFNFAKKQLVDAQKAATKDHAQRARKMAMEIRREFFLASIDENSNRYRKFMKHLAADSSTVKYVEKIWKNQPFEVKRELLSGYLPELLRCNKSPNVKVPIETVVKIRFAVVRELNATEAVALGYLFSVADTGVLDYSFRSFFYGEKYLENMINLKSHFGKAAGSWPAIDSLYNSWSLKKQNQ